MVDNIAIGKRLRIIREELGIKSQEDFYEKYLKGKINKQRNKGSSAQSFMSALENGREDYTPDILAAYSEAGNCSIDYLVKGENHVEDGKPLKLEDSSDFSDIARLFFDLYEYAPFSIAKVNLREDWSIESPVYDSEEYLHSYQTYVLYFHRSNDHSEKIDHREDILTALLGLIGKIISSNAFTSKQLNFDTFTPLKNRYLSQFSCYDAEGIDIGFLRDDEIIKDFHDINYSNIYEDFTHAWWSGVRDEGLPFN